MLAKCASSIKVVRSTAPTLVGGADTPADGPMQESLGRQLYGITEQAMNVDDLVPWLTTQSVLVDQASRPAQRKGAGREGRPPCPGHIDHDRIGHNIGYSMTALYAPP